MLCRVVFYFVFFVLCFIYYFIFKSFYLRIFIWSAPSPRHLLLPCLARATSVPGDNICCLFLLLPREMALPHGPQACWPSFSFLCLASPWTFCLVSLVLAPREPAGCLTRASGGLLAFPSCVKILPMPSAAWSFTFPKSRPCLARDHAWQPLPRGF